MNDDRKSVLLYEQLLNSQPVTWITRKEQKQHKLIQRSSFTCVKAKKDIEGYNVSNDEEHLTIYTQLLNIRPETWICAKQKKTYYEANKERILQQTKEYRKNNKASISKYKKRYYRENKHKLDEYKSKKIECECGSKIRCDYLSVHRKSKKHQNYINHQR